MDAEVDQAIVDPAEKGVKGEHGLDDGGGGRQ